MTKLEKRLKVVSLILVAALIFTALFNVLLIGGMPYAAGTSETATNTSGGFVESNMDFSSVREQYLDFSQVQSNIASFDGDRWVIVELEGETLYDKFGKSIRYNEFSDFCASDEGARAQANMRAEQSSFLKKLDKRGIDYTVKYSYTSVINAVGIKVNADAFNAINDMNGVKGVYYSESYAVPKTIATTNNANVYSTGIYDSSELDYKGEGMVVAILDTGLDYTHEAFQNMPTEPGWDFDYVDGIVEQGKLNAQGDASDFYYNSKIPFAYDYADDDPNVYPSSSSHGTHVAGIVAGKSEYVVNEETGEKFIGVAPEAQLMICKVFSDNLDDESIGGANTLDILAALNDCTQMGVDVINMSLGSSAGFADEKSDARINDIYNAVRAAGISLVVAASNDYSSGYGGGNGTNLASNPDSSTVGSPSTYPAALSVASINGQKSSYFSTEDDNYVAFITNSSDQYGVQLEFIEQLYKIANESRKARGEAEVKFGEDLHFRYVVIGGVGRPQSYTGPVRNLLKHDNAVADGYDGTVAFVKRGDTTFAEKVQAAMAAGADACVIYNNVAGTIRMSLGEVENPIPTCSITMDAATGFVDSVNSNKGYGVMKLNTNMAAGPFMSDFSSWGPLPNLELKPEITAHGGEITSAVAGGYDKLSGTSMAAPNMAGAVALLRQYLQTEYPELSGTELNARVNQVLMSTATIAYNENGNPYSPRKQGAGLAGIADAINAQGYITVLDGNDHGEVRDKTKLELFDDPEKKGVYELNFIIHNISDTQQTYKPVVHVMTETMSSDLKTVAEKAYMLNDDCTIKYFVGSDMNGLTAHSGDISVAAGESLVVRVQITLNDTARAYLDKNFENGMYIEGFVSMQGTKEGQVTLGLPYLAFYGDWTDAPLFDYDAYELAESDKDTSLRPEEKLKASAAETRVIGMYEDDKYILPLGTYIYNQDDEDVKIYPERDKIAVSMYDAPGARTIYEIYMVYAGLLRGASYMDVVITDDATGEVIYSKRLENISKSYAAGGSNRGAGISIELKPSEWGLNNNSKYNVTMIGELDYGMYEDENGVEHGALAGSHKYKKDENGNYVKDSNGDYIVDTEAQRNTFSFPFTVDYEDPQVTGYRIRYVPYTENRVTKYKIWMDVDVYDNQYVQAVLPCYLEENKDGENALRLLTEYAIPVYGQKGETTTVSFEITDIYDDFVKTGQMYLEVEDYAMNSTNYRFLPGQDGFGSEIKDYPEKVELIEDAKLVKDETPQTDETGKPYDESYTLTLAPYTLYKLNTNITPAGALIQNLTWEGATNRIKAKDAEIYAGQSGSTVLKLKDEFGKIYAVIRVNIEGAPSQSAPKPESIKLGAVRNGEGYVVSLDDSLPVLELNPEQKGVQLTWTVTPWYCDPPEVIWTSSNENFVEVDEVGNITAKKRGSAYVEVTSKENSRITKSVRIIVGDAYNIRNYTLYDYYGSGIVEIPSDRNIMYLDEDCFKGNTEITKVILPSTLTEIPVNAFKGCVNLEEVVIPGQCTTIKQSAFEGCTKLKKIVLGKFVDSEKNEIGEQHPDKYFGTLTVARHAFKGCTSLETIENARRLTTLYQGAFEGCTALKEIDITQVRVVANEAFKGCTALETVITSEATQIGEYMFADCTALTEFDFKGTSIAAYAFSGCTALNSFTMSGSVNYIGEGAFNNTALSSVTLPNGKVVIGAEAFADCANLTRIVLSADTEYVPNNLTPFTGCEKFAAFEINGNNSRYSIKDGVLFSKDGKTVVAVPYAKTSVDLTGVTAIGDSAFAGLNITEIDLSGVTSIGEYAFANSSIVSAVLPSGLKAIPEGLFGGCTVLTSVTAADNFASVKTIGAMSFFGCKKLEEFKAENATEVQAHAFTSSGLKTLPSSKLVTVGVEAFAETELTEVILPALENIGAGAFMNITSLRTVNVGAIKYMGESAFYNASLLERVTLANGTTAISELAFSGDNTIRTRITVTLPGSVEYIGAGAFMKRSGLTRINLLGVKYVDMMAFYSTGLAEADLSTIIETGYAAFAGTNLKSVNLDSMVYIGDSTFRQITTLTSVTMGKVETIGSSAFMGTSLETVEIPATMNNRTYVYEWNEYDHKNRVEQERARNELALGIGAFSEINGFKGFTVADGNEIYKSIDGVLYSVSDDGLVLEQYPCFKEGKEYKVVDGTVALADTAFTSSQYLEKVELPYTVKSIGSYAFFNSSVKTYVFNSVDAPALMADYDDEIYSLENSAGQQMMITQFHKNFYYYSIMADEALQGDEPQDFGLTMIIPRNGRGYDGRLWKVFFTTIEQTEEILPENATHNAKLAIDALSTEGIDSMTLEQINAKGGIGEQAANARKLYNLITDSEQLALLTEELVKLENLEKALRDRKLALNAPAYVSKLVMAKWPSQTTYTEGDSFDPAGLVIVAIYDDGSEVFLKTSDYLIDPLVLDYGRESVTITYTENGKTVTLEVGVQVNRDPNKPDPTPIEPVNPNKPATLDKNATIAIAVAVPVGVLLIAGIAVLIVLKKKKASKKDGESDENADIANGQNEKTEETAEAQEQIAQIAEEATAEPVESEEQEATENTVETEAQTAEENAEVADEPTEEKTDGEDAE